MKKVAWSDAQTKTLSKLVIQQFEALADSTNYISRFDTEAGFRCELDISCQSNLLASLSGNYLRLLQHLATKIVDCAIMYFQIH